MQANRKELVPKELLYGIFGMVLLSLIFVFSTSDSSKAKLVEPDSSKVLGSRVLHLTKLDNGSVALSNLENEEIFNSRDGKSGFLSVIMTGLEYNRKKLGIELTDSYSVKISRLSSGRISLEDSQADWSLNVTSFGSKNSELFLSIFKRGEK
jgi:putative photosynthetic complex assembly protein